MDTQQLVRELKIQNKSKIVLLVADGLGGLPIEPGGPTELEAAKTPNLDKLANHGVQGSMYPIAPGITPGSGPGHLGLFGYDPVKYLIGRGALEATGVGFKLGPKDVAVAGQFLHPRRRRQHLRPPRRPNPQRGKRPSGHQIAAGESAGRRGVRRAGQGASLRGHFPRRRARRQCGRHRPAADRRAAAGSGCPRPAEPANGRGGQAVRRRGPKLLAGQPKANGLTMRGFAAAPKIDSYADVYGLKAAAIAVYPMYKGLAQLVGMDGGRRAGHAFRADRRAGKAWNDYDFFFVHFKYTDSRGEDGNFPEKVRMIEQLDAIVPRIVALKPMVLIVTGDHSTPARLASHSWHPVPTLLVSETCRPDGLTAFGEKQALQGGLGHFAAVNLMPLAMAHAERLGKFGA